MRYYRLVISNPKTGEVFTPPGFSGLLGGASYTSFVNGQSLPAAWDVELNLPVSNVATPQGDGTARVWGISAQEIAQASNLNKMNIQIFGGMQKGLPLAKPGQSGPLVRGFIFQAFGNWIGVDMTLDMVIRAGPATSSFSGGIGTNRNPLNLTLNWPAGQPLSTALKNCLQIAFPGYTINTDHMSDDIVLPGTQVAPFPTLEQLAQYCRNQSINVIKTPGYSGLNVVVDGTTIRAFDNSSPPPGFTQILFEDLIGQPTWIESFRIQFKTVMRADLLVGATIKLPSTLTISAQEPNLNMPNQRVLFQGTFNIQSIRHFGRYRQPTADAWVTVIEAVPSLSSLASLPAAA